MNQPIEDRLTASLINIMTDGFNRSLTALEDAGAIDATQLRSDYEPGSEYYALATAALEATAKSARSTIRKILEEETNVWSVWRQDDNGNEFMIASALSESEAKSFAEEFESRGHKQIYWLRRGQG